jgi:hypothetical protein
VAEERARAEVAAAAAELPGAGAGGEAGSLSAAAVAAASYEHSVAALRGGDVRRPLSVLLPRRSGGQVAPHTESPWGLA